MSKVDKFVCDECGLEFSNKLLLTTKIRSTDPKWEGGYVVNVTTFALRFDRMPGVCDGEKTEIDLCRKCTKERVKILHDLLQAEEAGNATPA